jgi:two-component system sensor histidine kinase DesK
VRAFDGRRTSAVLRRAAQLRVGQLFGLLFLIGPVGDLADGAEPAGQTAAIVVCLAAFLALYLMLLPPAGWLARRGERAVALALAALAALAGLSLALGAPRSFTLLFFYVVVAGGLLLPTPAAVVLTSVTAVAVATGLAVTGSNGSTVAAYALSLFGIGALTASLGSVTRANRELRAVREELARRAVADERERFARDLHDLLGHTLSLIALKSELAGRLVDDDPEAARTELAEIAQVTREALAEVRAAVHGYRRLGVADALDRARATLSAAGVEARVEGVAPALSDDVESVLALAVREAATNVARHSGARACTIRLTPDGDGDGVVLLVEDDGRGAARSDGEGSGLAGLAERARAVDGTLEAGTAPDGGFRFRLEISGRAS